MTPKQERFVEEYMIDLNATQAAVRSGYSKKTAMQIGQQNLCKLEIKAAIETARAELSVRARISADSVMTELGKLGYSNILDYVTINADGSVITDLSRVTRDQAAAITEITIEEYMEGKGDRAERVKSVKIKLADKRAALVDIGRHLGLFKENNTAVAIVVNIGSDDANL